MIRCLNKETCDQMRASSTIGSVPRALEELIRNSIVHGKAKSVVVQYIRGSSQNNHMSTLYVLDDGIGIDPNALQKYIGETYCSSVNKDTVRGSSREGNEGQLSPYFTKRRQYNATNNHECNDLTRNFEKTNPILAQQHGNGASLLALVTLSHQVTIISKTSKSSTNQNYVKKFCNGTAISFTKRSCMGISSINKNESLGSNSGTSISITGLFHRHAVRSKHQQLLHEQRQQKTFSLSTTISSSTSSQQRSEINQMRNGLKIISLAFPNVNITFQHIERHNQDLSRSISNTAVETWPTSSFLRLNSDLDPNYFMNALLYRIGTITGNENVCSNLKLLRYSEVQYPKASIHGKWTAAGFVSNPVNDLPKLPKRCQYIFINGRGLRNMSTFISTVESTYQSLTDYPNLSCSNMVFVIHIQCPNLATDVVIEDSLSMISVRDKGYLKSFLNNAVTSTLNTSLGKRKQTLYTIDADEERGVEYLARKTKTLQPAYRPLASLSQSKIIKSTEITLKSARKDILYCGTKNTEYSPAELSPFSRAFFDNHPYIPAIEDTSERKGNIKVADEIKFEQNLDWTRARIKSFEEQLSNAVSKENEQISSFQTCTITKKMLSDSKIIAQLDKKFILLKMDNILCIVDQHAADERIRLERHEKELGQRLSRSIEDEESSSNSPATTYRNWRRTSFEKVTLQPSQTLQLTTELFNVAYQYRDILLKWNFTLNFKSNPSNLEHRVQTAAQKSNQNYTAEVQIVTLPKLCGKLVSVENDFLPYLNTLLHHSSNDSLQLQRPPFVHRILASQACRYAVMFGDELNKEECKNIVDQLQECNMSFVCAHGRPSVVPLKCLNFHDDEALAVLQDE